MSTRTVSASRIFEMSFLMRLQNDEFPQLVNNIISVVKEDALSGEDQLSQAFFRLKTHEVDSIKEIRYYTQKHPLTAELNRRAEQRREHLYSLRYRVQAGMLSQKEEERQHALQLDNWLEPNKGKFAYPGVERQSRLVHNLAEALNAEEEKATALDALGLREIFEHLLNASVEMESLFRQRNKDMVRERERVKNLRKEIYVDLRSFLNVLESAARLEESPDGIYKQWVAEISKFMEHYRREYEKRRSLRKKRKGKQSVKKKSEPNKKEEPKPEQQESAENEQIDDEENEQSDDSGDAIDEAPEGEAVSG